MNRRVVPRAWRQTLIVLSIMCLGTAMAAAQNPYSESKPYKPRPEPQKKKRDDKKQKVAARDVASPIVDAPLTPAATVGEQTVRIPVSVFDRTGNAVDGITSKDVTVFVDDASVSVATFEQSSAAPNIILVLDTSASTQVQLKAMREQAWKLVQAFPTGTRVAVVDFDSDMDVRTQLTDNRSEIQSALANPKNPGSGTSIYTAVRTLFQNVLPRIPGQNVVILMTDGIDTTSRSSTFSDSLTEVEKHGVPIYPVYFDTSKSRSRVTNDVIQQAIDQAVLQRGMKLGATEEEYKTGLLYLNDLAAATGGRVISSERLEAGAKSLIDELTSKYYATVVVPGKTNRSRPIRVRVSRPNLSVSARGSFVDQ